MEINKIANKALTDMFESGAHFGLGRSRRHPTVSQYIFATKNKTDIFDLEKTITKLDLAKAFVTNMAKTGKILLFIGGKKESANAVKLSASSINMPYVDSRFIGGTMTNFGQIRKRIERYEKLTTDKEKGELAKYTKRERMLIDKEIASLEKMFFGIVSLKKIPDAVFVIDPRYEKNAVNEALNLNIPIIALASSDCDIDSVEYPIPANDSSRKSIQFFLDEITKAYKAGIGLV